MKILKENTVALTYLENLTKLILLVSVLKHSERAAARQHHGSEGKAVVNPNCRNVSILLLGMGTHRAKHWLSGSRVRVW